MQASNRSELRHIVMRLALALVLGWFGVQELHNPSDWGVFVPHFIGHRYPGAVEQLVLAHGFLLLLAGAAIGLGLSYMLGCLLAAGMLGEVTLWLWIDGGGINDLVVRDIGLLGLAAALLIDPARAWHLDRAITGWWDRARRHAARGKPSATSLRRQVLVRGASSAALIGALLAAALVIRATGTSGASPGNVGGLASAHTQASPTTAARAAATPTSRAQGTQATPSGATRTGTLFADWQYRRYAFEVYPGPISQDATDALAGFDVSVQDQGSSVQLTFKALSSRYHDATVTVDKQNTAYFVETSMRDDPNGQENELNDDGVVVVDPQGYLLQS